MNLRIGPYVCAEWTYGGFPAWLGFRRGLAFRDANSQFQSLVEGWFDRVVDELYPYFPQRGGPVVLVQVENELEGASQEYVDWNGEMAERVLTSWDCAVPIIMCYGQSADNTINTCNGQDCVDFLERGGEAGRVLRDQPALWTENEMGYQARRRSRQHLPLSVHPLSSEHSDLQQLHAEQFDLPALLLTLRAGIICAC